MCYRTRSSLRPLVQAAEEGHTLLFPWFATPFPYVPKDVQSSLDLLLVNFQVLAAVKVAFRLSRTVQGGAVKLVSAPSA